MEIIQKCLYLIDDCESGEIYQEIEDEDDKPGKSQLEAKVLALYCKLILLEMSHSSMI